MPASTPSQRVLLWDVMGTIVYDPFYRELPDFLGVSFEELLKIKHPSSWVEFEKGRMSHQAFMDSFFADGRSYDQQGMVDCFKGAFEFLDGIEALLTDLHVRGDEIHYLSNYPVWYEWIEDKLNLSRFGEWTFVSCRTGLRKPAAAAFEHAIQTLGRNAGDCWFIDDRTNNTQAAEALGMKTILFESAAQARTALGL